MRYDDISLETCTCLRMSQASQASQAAAAWLVRLQLVRLPVVHRLVVAWLLQLPLEEVAHRLVVACLTIEEVADTQVAQVAHMADTPSGKVVIPGALGGKVTSGDIEVLGSEPETWKAWASQASQASQASSRCKASCFRCPDGFCRDCGQKPCRLAQNNCPGTLGQVAALMHVLLSH